MDAGGWQLLLGPSTNLTVRQRASVLDASWTVVLSDPVATVLAVEHGNGLTVVQAYRFALDPTPRQVRDLLRHAGAARVAFNWGLARIKANLDQRGAERSYGIAEADLTPPVGWSLYALRKDWNRTKARVAPWWAECSKEACNTGLDQLARALKNWADSRKGARKVRRVGFPRFKSSNAARNRVHHRVVNLRRDAIGKLTTGLAREYSTIVVEDLNVAGMVKNRRLARAVSDAGFGEIHRQLAYKTVWNGGRLIVADRWYPSSKRCSGCGVVKAKLRLSERTYTCTTCGLAIDRDTNAALNLASLVKHVVVAGSGPETKNGRRADHKTRPVRAGGCETSTPHRAVPAQVGRGPSPSNERITEIY